MCGFGCLLYLLNLLLIACSSAPKIEQSDPYVNKSIHKQKNGDSIGELILKTATSQLGKAYKYGGTSPKIGFDCSGLTWYSHQKNGIKITRRSSDQFKGGKQILLKELQPGDLVFFQTYRSGASHVGIYAGGGNFIHSLNRSKNIAIQSLSNRYYKKRYLGARRYW